MKLSIPIHTHTANQGKAAQAAAQEMKKKIKIEIEVDAEIVRAGGNRKRAGGTILHAYATAEAKLQHDDVSAVT